MRIFIIGLYMVILITGCKSEGGQKNENFLHLKAEFEQKYANWKSLDIQNYYFIYHISNLGYWAKVTVKNGTYYNTVGVYSNEPEEPVYETIDAIFDTIERDFFIEKDYNYPSGKIGTNFSVCYDSHYHYPKKYTIINMYDQSYGYVGGNGYTISITDFSLLE